GIGQRLLVGGKRRFRIFLGPLRVGEIALDTLVPLLEDAADARDRDARDQQVESNESDDQPDDLRGERLLLERRKAAAMFARRNMLGRRDRLWVLRHGQNSAKRLAAAPIGSKNLEREQE